MASTTDPAAAAPESKGIARPFFFRLDMISVNLYQDRVVYTVALPVKGGALLDRPASRPELDRVGNLDNRSLGHAFQGETLGGLAQSATVIVCSNLYIYLAHGEDYSMNRFSLLEEIEDIINSMPPRATLRHRDKQENLDWFGRASAAIAKWNPSKSAAAKEYIELFFSNRHAREAEACLTNVQVLLNEAKNELRMEAAGLKGPVTSMEKKVFIGHGRSTVWHQLKIFLNDRLHLPCDEFNAEAVAGMSTTSRLQQMLDNAWFAFLIMTAEDMHADETSHAGENVIHEAGLFQGRLGFERAIILLEEGCVQFLKHPRPDLYPVSKGKSGASL